MARFLAVAGNSCLAIGSLIVFLTMFWLINVRSLYVEVQLNNKQNLRMKQAVKTQKAL